ncbi:MAG: hypothetical protein ACFFCW_13590 [Candidatus Hodarchaeota archaeon]
MPIDTNENNQNKWARVRISRALLDQIKAVVKDESYGYMSLREFVTDAVRLRLLELKKLKKLDFD